MIRGGFAVNHYDEGWIPWENVATGSISNQTVSLNPGRLGSPLESISFDPSGASLPPLNRFQASFSLPMPEVGFDVYSRRLFQHG